MDELVRELRRRLKEHVETAGKGQEERFSMVHYEELMDPNSSCTAQRYLDYYDGNVDKALEQAKRTLAWRKEQQLDEPNKGELTKEKWHTAPITRCGVSRDGFDVFYVLVRNYRKPDARFRPIARKFFLLALHKWDREHARTLDKFDMVFDVSDTGFRNIDLDFAGWMVSLRDYFPARVNRILVVGIPFIVRPLIRIVISWLPEKFSSITYCGTFEELVEANYDWNNLPIEVGGTRDESYRLAPPDAPWIKDSEFYSDPALVKMFEDCSCFWMDSERREKLRLLQLEHEKKNQTSNGSSS